MARLGLLKRILGAWRRLTGPDTPQAATPELPTLYRYHYICPECNFRWMEVWDGPFDDICIRCATDDISPVRATPVFEE